jgi:two-component system chemotaxis response regulator CheY
LNRVEQMMTALNPKIRILTVDDSATMRGLLKNALVGQGFEVEQADDGISALEWLASNDCDVVITDINMPRLDGFGLIERVRAGGAHVHRPILVLSTESSDEKKARARIAGATGWIVKPFDAEKLAAAVRRVTH